MAIQSMSAPRTPAACAHCGRAVPPLEARHFQGHVLCRRCWADLVRTGIADWLPYRDRPAEGEPARPGAERRIA